MLGSHRFWKFDSFASIVGAAVGAIAPQDASAPLRVGYAVAAAAVTALLGAVLVYLISLARAPTRQRDEARRELLDVSTARLVFKPGVDVEHIPYSFVNDADSWRSIAKVRVYNEQERGGKRATAEHVSPELRILSNGTEVFGWKGWDTVAWREFTTSGEEHALWIASKVRGRPNGNAIKAQQEKLGTELPEGTFDVRVTLRGHNIEPLEGRFTLTNPGAGGDLRIEAG
jgi:hypothetical protein